MANIHLTHRSLNDIQDIYDYSSKKWGRKQADKYLKNIENALKLLEDTPKPLLIKPKISMCFKLYQVDKHWLICDTKDGDIYILTIKHVSMNLLERLKELQPSLIQEAKLLSRKIPKR